MHLPSVPFATEIHDAAMEMSGISTYWNSIMIKNVLKPIASGHTSPTSLERNILNSYIMECRSLLAFLDTVEAQGYSTTETSRLREAVGSNVWVLYKSRIILRDRIERCSIATAPGPIRRLPPELVSEILYYCLPQLSRPDPSTPPLMFCRVSPLWRDIARATHSLWNRLDFTSQRKPNLRRFIQLYPSCEHLTSPVHRWLSCASRSQITMAFRSDDDVLPDLVNMVLLPNVLDLLRLEIRLPLQIARSPFHQFFSLPPHTLQSLKYLIMTQGLPDARITVFQASPCLTHLLLDDLHFAVDPYRPGEIPILQPVFPWVQITHLTILRCIDLELWVSTLSSCQSLEVGFFSLDLRGLDFNPGHNGNDSDFEDEDRIARVHVCGSSPIPMVGEPVILSFLKELDLIVGCGESFPLKGFSFPALEALRFHRGHMPHVSPYQQHLIASQPDTFSWKNSLMFLSALESINVLSLVGRVGSVEEITLLFHHVPSVNFLHLDLEVDHLALFRALTINSSDPPTTVPLPHLGHLRLLLDAADMQCFPENAIQDMVLSRLSSPHTLERLNILTNTFRNGHFNIIKNIAKSTNLYIPTSIDVDLKASRAVPWKRYANM